MQEMASRADGRSAQGARSAAPEHEACKNSQEGEQSESYFAGGPLDSFRPPKHDKFRAILNSPRANLPPRLGRCNNATRLSIPDKKKKGPGWETKQTTVNTTGT